MFELDELGRADELDGTTELLLGAMLDELGKAEELLDTTELLLGAMLEEDGLLPASTLLDDNASRLELEIPVELLFGSAAFPL